MIVINCPLCGPRGHEEFAYQGDATVKRPADDAPLQAWSDYVFVRDNPRGPHRELWHHVHGCRAYVVVTRDTLTHEITGTALPHPTLPHPTLPHPTLPREAGEGREGVE